MGKKVDAGMFSIHTASTPAVVANESYTLSPKLKAAYSQDSYPGDFKLL